MLSIVVPPDFDPEATSSDMMVGEGGQVNIFLYVYNLISYQEKAFNNNFINNLRNETFLVIRNNLSFAVLYNTIKCSSRN